MKGKNGFECMDTPLTSIAVSSIGIHFSRNHELLLSVVSLSTCLDSTIGTLWQDGTRAPSRTVPKSPWRPYPVGARNAAFEAASTA